MPAGPGRTRLSQDLFMADGSTRKVGHVAYFNGPDEHVTEQYAIGPDGAWTLESKLVWRRDGLSTR
jgi:hypothetical protein